MRNVVVEMLSKEPPEEIESSEFWRGHLHALSSVRGIVEEATQQRDLYIRLRERAERELQERDLTASLGGTRPQGFSLREQWAIEDEIQASYLRGVQDTEKRFLDPKAQGRQRIADRVVYAIVIAAILCLTWKAMGS